MARLDYAPQERFMEVAIDEATACMSFGDKPVGAVVVQGDEIVSQSGNRTYRDKVGIHHAEVVTIRDASRQLDQKHLSDCVLYVTHEPCPMCAGATIYSRLGGVVFGTYMEDADRFVEDNPGQIWRSVRIPLASIVELGDQDIFISGGFMREGCKELFDRLLQDS